MKRPVTIVGSYNVGLFLKGKQLPSPGQTVIADQFVESGGGKGSNCAVAASIFGAQVRFVGCLGDDNYGHDALSMYRRLGIDTRMVKIDPSIHSGISVILIGENGSNLISVVPGANLRLSVADLDAVESDLRGSYVVAFQLENCHDTVFAGIRKASALGVKVFLDPAPAVPLPDELFRFIDIIKPNETEASIITGVAVRDVESARRAGRWLVDRGVKKAIVTLGESGAVFCTEGKEHHFPAPCVRAVDSTGAGDVFSGALLTALAEGKEDGAAIEFANHAASLSTTRLGVIESIPTLAEVRAFMESRHV